MSPIASGQPTKTATESSTPPQVQTPLILRGVPYTPDKPVSGELSIYGSTAMQQLAVLWMEEFRQIHPESKAVIDCNGSEESFKKLEVGKSIVGLVSREVSQDELDRWSIETGAKLVAVSVGYDVLALIVHPENPLRILGWNAKLRSPLTLRDDKRGTNWGQFGVAEPLADQPIHFHVLSKSHAIRAYADQFLLRGGDGSELVKEHETQSDVQAAVASDPNSLGLVSAHRVATKKVRPLKLAISADQIISPMDPLVIDRGYPLIRKLNLVLIAPEDSKEDPLVNEFLAFVLSRQGQEVLCKDGFVPLDGSELILQLEKLGRIDLK
jgi:phosphate transport system substrate-binding protein